MHHPAAGNGLDVRQRRLAATGDAGSLDAAGRACADAAERARHPEHASAVDPVHDTTPRRQLDLLQRRMAAARHRPADDASAAINAARVTGADATTTVCRAVHDAAARCELDLLQRWMAAARHAAADDDRTASAGRTAVARTADRMQHAASRRQLDVRQRRLAAARPPGHLMA